MLLGAFRGGNPLERIVGVRSLWPRPVEFFNSTGWALYGQSGNASENYPEFAVSVPVPYLSAKRLNQLLDLRKPRISPLGDLDKSPERRQCLGRFPHLQKGAGFVERCVRIHRVERQHPIEALQRSVQIADSGKCATTVEPGFHMTIVPL